MTAKEALAKAKECSLYTIKSKIDQATRLGLMSCSMPYYHLTSEAATYLQDNGYKYEKYINRGGWFTETELLISWGN